MADLDSQDEGLNKAAKLIEKVIGDGRATDPMIESLFRLTQYLKSTYGINYFGGHQEVLPARFCPGNIGMEWVDKIRRVFKMKTPNQK